LRVIVTRLNRMGCVMIVKPVKTGAQVRQLGAVVALLGVLMLAPGAAAAAQSVLELLKTPGHVALMRHAWAPFEGAPKEGGKLPEQLGGCETQRNLDDKGRADARRIGELFRERGIAFDKVYTSKWCRCVETADLIIGRKVDNLELINSYYTSPDKATRGPAQLAALKRYINATLARTDRVLLITHGSLISDLAGIDTGETEIVVVKADGNGGIVVVGHGVP